MKRLSSLPLTKLFATLVERANGLGMDVTTVLEEGRLEIQQVDPAEFGAG